MAGGVYDVRDGIVGELTADAAVPDAVAADLPPKSSLILIAGVVTHH